MEEILQATENFFTLAWALPHTIYPSMDILSEDIEKSEQSNHTYKQYLEK